MNSSIKKNIVYQVSYELLILVLPILTAPYVSRVLGSDGLGIYSYTYNIANYFVLFAALGIKNYGNREISRVRDDKESLDYTFSSILGLHCSVSAVVVLSYIGYWCFIASAENKIYSLISGIYVVAAFFDISWLFFGLEKFKTTVTRSTVIKIVSIVCIFAFVNSKEDLWIYVLILALSNLASQLYLWGYVKRYVSIKKVPLAVVLKHLPQMSLLFIPTIAVSLYNNMDKIMVGYISGNSQLGFYENAEKICFMAITVIGSVGTVMLPRMSNILANGEMQKVKKYICVSMQCIMCVSFAMTFGLIGISRVFSPVFFGEEFRDCAGLLAVLSITLPIKSFANVIRTQYLIPSGKDKEYTISVCMGAIINLVLNFLLIVRVKAMGAVIATIVAEIVVCGIQTYSCRKDLPVFNYIKENVVFGIIAAFMGGVVYFEGLVMRINIITLGIQIITGVLLFGTLTVIYSINSKNFMYHLFISKIIANLSKRRNKQ